MKEKEHKRKESDFTFHPKRKWLVDTYETRKPILWIACDGNECYLVNYSKVVLDLVIADCGGFQPSADDDNIVEYYQYENVKPNEAVKIEEYDGYYDLDYDLGIDIRIKSESLGYIEISTPTKKGGIGETVLLWDSGESGKNVNIKRINDE